MKKFIKSLMCFVLVCSSFSILTACSDKLTKIEVLNMENFQELEYGQVINWNNLKLKTTYANGKIITYNYSEIKKDLDIDLGDFDKTKSGIYNIKLTYKDKSCDFGVQVKAPVVSGIGITRTGLPEVINIEKVTADFKADFLNKITVRVFKTDGTNEVLDKNTYSIVNYDPFTNTFANSLNIDCLGDIGEHWFAVKYGDITPQTFSIRVKLGDENGFVLDLEEIEQDITIGEEIDFSKVKVYATFSDGRQILLENTEYTLDYSAFNNEVAGEYKIKVSYKHYLDKTFTISVSE